MATKADQKGDAASTTPLTARNRGCRHRCSNNRAYNPAQMKCFGVHRKALIWAVLWLRTSNNPKNSI